jgi:hypothetical protein
MRVSRGGLGRHNGFSIARTLPLVHGGLRRDLLADSHRRWSVARRHHFPELDCSFSESAGPAPAGQQDASPRLAGLLFLKQVTAALRISSVPARQAKSISILAKPRDCIKQEPSSGRRAGQGDHERQGAAAEMARRGVIGPEYFALLAGAAAGWLLG